MALLGGGAPFVHLSVLTAEGEQLPLPWVMAPFRPRSMELKASESTTLNLFSSILFFSGIFKKKNHSDIENRKVANIQHLRKHIIDWLGPKCPSLGLRTFYRGHPGSCRRTHPDSHAPGTYWLLGASLSNNTTPHFRTFACLSLNCHFVIWRALLSTHTILSPWWYLAQFVLILYKYWLLRLL